VSKHTASDEFILTPDAQRHRKITAYNTVRAQLTVLRDISSGKIPARQHRAVNSRNTMHTATQHLFRWFVIDFIDKAFIRFSFFWCFILYRGRFIMKFKPGPKILSFICLATAYFTAKKHGPRVRARYLDFKAKHSSQSSTYAATFLQSHTRKQCTSRFTLRLSYRAIYHALFRLHQRRRTLRHQMRRFRPAPRTIRYFDWWLDFGLAAHGDDRFYIDYFTILRRDTISPSIFIAHARQRTPLSPHACSLANLYALVQRISPLCFSDFSLSLARPRVRLAPAWAHIADCDADYRPVPAMATSLHAASLFSKHSITTADNSTYFVTQPKPPRPIFAAFRFWHNIIDIDCWASRSWPRFIDDLRTRTSSFHICNLITATARFRFHAYSYYHDVSCIYWFLLMDCDAWCSLHISWGLSPALPPIIASIRFHRTPAPCRTSARNFSWLARASHSSSYKLNYHALLATNFIWLQPANSVTKMADSSFQPPSRLTA
jgi:hypothetical protein